MSECLRRSEVVAADTYRLSPPPHRCVAPAAVAPKQQQRSSTATKETNAAAEGCFSSASPAATGKKRVLTSGGEETTGGLVATINQRVDVAGGSASGCGAAAGLMNLEGGVGARKLDVDKRRVSQGQPSSLWGPQSPNKEAADMLDGLAELCATRGGDGSVFNERGFKSAAAALRMLGTQITDIEQLKDLRKNDPERVRGIGDGAMKELTAFFAEGKGKARPPVSEADPPALEACLKLFQEVGWVGAVKAQQLYDKGMRSIEDLRTRGRHLLTEQMRVCLNRHEDIKQRMPRSEAAEIEAAVTKVAQSICPGACGSYRRGNSNCGDVDVLIRPPEGQEDSPMFLELIKELTETGFITDRLTMPEGPYTPGKPQTFMGVCKLPGEGQIHRRLDIKLYPTSMFAFAVLYFTGSGDFNMNMRCFAKSKGLKLNDKGLFKVDPFSGEEVRNSGYSCLGEEDVFSALGMDWIEPKDRKGVGPASDNHQEALLQHQAIPMAEASLWSWGAAGSYYENAEQQMQQQQQMMMMQQQAEVFFREEDQVQQAIRLSRGVFDAGGGSVAAAAAGGRGAGAAIYDGSSDHDLQEALRRSVADTRFAVGVGEREVVAGGSGSTATAASSAEGNNGVGTGSEHSPVCL
ncbi:unnamed protein product [Ectocarpus sp. 8 AP-2014]